MNERELSKETLESFTIYEMGGKYIPTSKLAKGDQEFFSTLEKYNGVTKEVGSIEPHLNFFRAYTDKKTAADEAKKKWGVEINPIFVELKERYSVINDQNNDPVAVKKTYTGNGSLVQEQTRLLKTGQLGKQDPAYALAAIASNLKTGVYTQQDSRQTEYNNLQKAKVIPLPNVVEVDLISERQAHKQLIPEVGKNLVGKAQIQKNTMGTIGWLKGKAGDLVTAKRVVGQFRPENLRSGQAGKESQGQGR